MSAKIHEPPSGAKERKVLVRDTGFPEPLCSDRNTTLPHPEADTSQNACIEAPKIDLAHKHGTLSFLHGRHHSQDTSNASITVKAGGGSGVGQGSTVKCVDGRKENKEIGEIEKEAETKENTIDPLS